ALAGTMVPMGDAKGTALALMVELLSAGLVGAHFGYEASSFFSAEGPAPGVGQMILAIDPVAFSGPGTGQGSAAALGRIDELAKAIEAESGARVPGARRAELKRQAAAEGISVDDALLSEIEALGRHDSA